MVSSVSSSGFTPDPQSFLPLPQAQFHVLVALTAGDLHGYAIMGAVEESSGGVVAMGPATLYGTLKKLVQRGLVEESDHRPAVDDERRRYYRLTGLGQSVCRAEADRLADLVSITRSNLRPGLA
jgi:DNA-binding PadR family transcriptional regulator